MVRPTCVRNTRTRTSTTTTSGHTHHGMYGDTMPHRLPRSCTNQFASSEKLLSTALYLLRGHRPRPTGRGRNCGGTWSDAHPGAPGTRVTGRIGGAHRQPPPRAATGVAPHVVTEPSRGQ